MFWDRHACPLHSLNNEQGFIHLHPEVSGLRWTGDIRFSKNSQIIIPCSLLDIRFLFSLLSTPVSELPHILNAPDHPASSLRSVKPEGHLFSFSPLHPLSSSPPQVFWHKKQTSAMRMLMAGTTWVRKNSGCNQG